MWIQSWWLARKEIKYNSYAFLFTGLVVVLLGLWASMMLYQTIQYINGADMLYNNSFALDIIFVGLTPSFAALFMSAPYLSFRTIKEDPFSKRMAFYRVLPISIRVLSMSRMLFMITTLFIMSCLFYLTLTVALPDHFFEYMTMPELMIFIAFWLGFALALGGSNTFVEFGTNGKFLFIFPLIYMVVFIAALLFFNIVLSQGIVESSLVLVRNHGYMPVLFSWLIGAVGFITWSKLLTRRLNNRDYV